MVVTGFLVWPRCVQTNSAPLPHRIKLYAITDAAAVLSGAQGSITVNTFCSRRDCRDRAAAAARRVKCGGEYHPSARITSRLAAEAVGILHHRHDPRIRRTARASCPTVYNDGNPSSKTRNATPRRREINKLENRDTTNAFSTTDRIAAHVVIITAVTGPPGHVSKYIYLLGNQTVKTIRARIKL